MIADLKPYAEYKESGLPYTPDAWIKQDATKVGYEVSSWRGSGRRWLKRASANQEVRTVMKIKIAISQNRPQRRPLQHLTYRGWIVCVAHPQTEPRGDTVAPASTRNTNEGTLAQHE